MCWTSPRSRLGGLELEETAFSLSELVAGTVETFRPQATAKGLRSSARRFAPGSADALIGDPVRVRQILFNLLGNALKFTEPGSVHVRAATAPLGEGRQRVTLTVTDTGIGIERRASGRDCSSRSSRPTVRPRGGSAAAALGCRSCDGWRS